MKNENQSGHTPGPWTVDDNGIRAGTELISTAYGFVVNDKVVYTPEVFANARLIAAAPDLLCALEWLLLDQPLPEKSFTIGTSGGEQVILQRAYRDRIDEARKAISKAKGQSCTA